MNFVIQLVCLELPEERPTSIKVPIAEQAAPTLCTKRDFKGTFQANTKSVTNKKDLNDVTPAPFLVSFSQLPAVTKPPKKGQLSRH